MQHKEKRSKVIREHDGVVVSVSERSVEVRISVEDGSCEGCPAQQICQVIEMGADDGPWSGLGGDAADESSEGSGEHGAREYGADFVGVEGQAPVGAVMERADGERAVIEDGAGENSVGGAGGDNELTVTVWTDLAHYFEPDEEVVVSAERVMGVRAAVWTYVVPALLMVVILVVGRMMLGLSGNVTGGAALAAVALYYGILWLLRDRIERVLVLRIRKA